ncbi:MAG: YicC/YloC family endoribonuclease [Parachlamydiales bacterium]
MTAYSRSKVETSFGVYSIEIQSVNKRHLEMQCYVPANLLRFDAKIRAQISSRIHRGNVVVRIHQVGKGEENHPIHVNVPLLNELSKAWRTVADHLGYAEHEKLPLSLFSRVDHLFVADNHHADEEGIWEPLFKGLQEALDNLEIAKMQEGKSIQTDLLQRCGNLQKWSEEVASKASKAPNKLKDRLTERFAALSPGTENDERILREICIYVDKIDISEESLRLKTHLIKLEQLLKADIPTVGKELEFLLQEITREINTSGSKSQDLDIIQLTLQMKNEVERIREQVQNVE